MRIRAAERKAAGLTALNAKTLSFYATIEKPKAEWEGKFTRIGDGNTFEGEWKNTKTGEAVKDQLEVAANGLAVKLTRKGAGTLPLPKEFQGYLDSMMPGILKDRYPQAGIDWYAIFR